MMPGESVPDNDPCKFCRCDMGDVVCAIADCAPPPCEHPTSIPGKCCPVCNTGQYENEYACLLNKTLQPYTTVISGN
ncbi:hypothetical protein DPMN_108520 [Dreissena polymorpha]|uniref:VWFC domain-containing protein n=1 Tax=Dreissena polymorpha TaxID=45954 RepID=A0A9D4K8Y1_DREPO|nr:hypothetical protein DPMN_108520 [Dreissena polymorpha]